MDAACEVDAAMNNRAGARARGCRNEKTFITMIYMIGAPIQELLKKAIKNIKHVTMVLTQFHMKDLSAKTHFCSLRSQESGVRSQGSGVRGQPPAHRGLRPGGESVKTKS
jgi:hypothetical protein